MTNQTPLNQVSLICRKPWNKIHVSLLLEHKLLMSLVLTKRGRRLPILCLDQVGLVRLSRISLFPHMGKLALKFKLLAIYPMKEQTRTPKQVLLKTMTVNKGTDIVHNFFENMKYMEICGKIKPSSLMKQEDGWWTFDHYIAGKSRMKQKSVPEFGILDHVFIVGGLEWHVFVRIIPNEGGSTVTWTFISQTNLIMNNLKGNFKTLMLKLVIGRQNWRKNTKEGI